MAKVAVISAASRGIGKAIVLRLAREDYHVFVYSRSEENLQKLKQEAENQGGRLTTYVADAANKEDVEAFAAFVRAETGRIDVLINNAGIFMPGSMLKEEDSTFEAQLSLNIRSAYYLTKRLVDLVPHDNTGHIINMCSTASIQAYPDGASYCISKHALYGMTRVLREELKSQGVRVTAVLPGPTYTDSWAGVEVPQERFMQAADIAEAVYAAITIPSGTVVEDIVLRPQEGDL